MRKEHTYKTHTDSMCMTVSVRMSVSASVSM